MKSLTYQKVATVSLRAAVLFFLALFCAHEAAHAAKGRCNVMVDPDKLKDAKEKHRDKKVNDAGVAVESKQDLESYQRKANEDFQRDYEDKETKFREDLKKTHKENTRKHRQSMERCGGKDGRGKNERPQLTYARELVAGGYLNPQHLQCFCNNARNPAEPGKEGEVARRAVVPPHKEIRSVAGMTVDMSRPPAMKQGAPPAGPLEIFRSRPITITPSRKPSSPPASALPSAF